MRADSQASERAPHLRIGRYRVIAPLARGGMAEVFVVVRDGAQEPTVLKRLLLELEDHPTAAIRFKREAELATRLQHPRIVGTLRTALEEGRPTIEMELIPGHTVEAMMLTLAHHQRLPPLDCAVRVALDALEGLAYAHELQDDEGRPIGLVHRDISPRNILLGLDGAARLIDFGIARADWNGYLTAPGSILGTFSHASPEQAVAGPVDRRSDLYSLGVVLFEMVTGQSLVPLGETMEMLKRVTTLRPPPARELNPALPVALEAVLSRALEKRPEDRFADAQSFRRALEAAAPNDQTESRRRLAALLHQLFPESHATFAQYRNEATRIAREELVVPSQLGAEGPELTEQHTGLTELVGQKTVAERTMVVRRRTNSREIDIETKVVDRDGGTVTEPRALMASVTASPERQEPTAIRELRRTNRQLQRAVFALAIGVGSLAVMMLVQLRQEPGTATSSSTVRETSTPAETTANSPRAVLAPAPVAEPTPPPAAELAEPSASRAVAEPDARPLTAPRARHDRKAEAESEPPREPPPAAPSAPSRTAQSAELQLRARLAKLVEKLRSSPTDADLFEDTASALRRALEELPEGEQRSLRAKVQRAEVMNDAQILIGAAEAYLSAAAGRR